MAVNAPTFTIGIEEEYLLVDKETRGLVVDPPQTLMEEAEELCGQQVTAELLRSQIEVGTKVCGNIAEVREELARYLGNQHCPDCGGTRLNEAARHVTGQSFCVDGGVVRSLF